MFETEKQGHPSLTNEGFDFDGDGKIDYTRDELTSSPELIDWASAYVTPFACDDQNPFIAQEKAEAEWRLDHLEEAARQDAFEEAVSAATENRPPVEYVDYNGDGVNDGYYILHDYAEQEYHSFEEMSDIFAVPGYQ